MLYTSRATLLLQPVSGVVVVRLVDDHLILVPHEPSKAQTKCKLSYFIEPMVGTFSRVMILFYREGNKG
jgi:hypothetical protein